MKAWVMRGHGGLDQLALADVPDPVLSGDEDVIVRVHAAALNHLDLWTLEGLPGLNLRMPHILGGDAAGIVEAVAPGVRDVAVGQRVVLNPGVWCGTCEWCRAGEESLCTTYRLLGEHLPGTLAERVVVPARNVCAVPAPTPPLSWPEAAAFSLVTLTAWRMLMTRAKVQRDEVVLVWGVGGGVATAALQVAKLAGAFVIATSSSEDKLASAKRLGADATVNHRTGDVVKEVRRLTDKRGADVVVENVGEATWERSLRLLAPRGRVVTCGATTGPKVMTDLRRVFWYHQSILGSTMGNAAEYRDVLRTVGSGALRPVIDRTFPLAAAMDAFRRLAAGEQMGKIVVEMSR